MKQKIVKGPRKPPKRATKSTKPSGVSTLAVFCVSCLEDFPSWVMCNVDTLSSLFTQYAVGCVIRGENLPPPEEFEDFCQDMHKHCLEVVQIESATRH